MKAVLGILLLTACGGGGGGDDDDTPMDTAQAAVEVVTPCAGESETIESLGDRFAPQSVTITVGQIVKLVAEPTGTDPHNIMPGIGVPTDPALMVGSGETKCFRFNTAGTYNFRCSLHGFTGSVVVQ